VPRPDARRDMEMRYDRVAGSMPTTLEKMRAGVIQPTNMAIACWRAAMAALPGGIVASCG